MEFAHDISYLPSGKRWVEHVDTMAQRLVIEKAASELSAFLHTPKKRVQHGMGNPVEVSDSDNEPLFATTSEYE